MCSIWSKPYFGFSHSISIYLCTACQYLKGQKLLLLREGWLSARQVNEILRRYSV